MAYFIETEEGCVDLEKVEYLKIEEDFYKDNSNIFGIEVYFDYYRGIYLVLMEAIEYLKKLTNEINTRSYNVYTKCEEVCLQSL
jgi:hypothetical protein